MHKKISKFFVTTRRSIEPHKLYESRLKTPRTIQKTIHQAWKQVRSFTTVLCQSEVFCQISRVGKLWCFWCERMVNTLGPGRHKKLRDFFVHSDAFRFFVTHQQHNITTHELTRRDWCFYPSLHKAADKDRRYRYPPLDTLSGKRLKFCGVFPHNVDTMHPSGYPILVSSFVWWCIGTPISWCVCRWWCHGPCWYTLIISRTIWYLANQTPVGVSDTNIHHDIGVPMHHYTKLLTRIGDTDIHHWTHYLENGSNFVVFFHIMWTPWSIRISDPCQQLCVVMHRNIKTDVLVHMVVSQYGLITIKT